MKHFFSIIAVLVCLSIYAQDNQPITSHVITDDLSTFIIEYSIGQDVHFNIVHHDNKVWHIPFIKGAGYIQDIGKAALPSYNIIIGAQSVNPEISFVSLEADTIKNILLYPWIGMPVDLVGTPEPVFTMDHGFYQSDIQYPDNQAIIFSNQNYKGQNIFMVRICPFSYNPYTQTLIVHRRFEIIAENLSSGITNSNIYVSATGRSVLKNVTVNQAFNVPVQKSQELDNAPVYMIITHEDYIDAANAIATWREQTGYKTEIYSSSYWTATDVTNTIRNRYFSPLQKPDYLLLIGDHNKLPGNQYNTSLGIFPTDKPYVCLDGANDYVADIAIGRVSVTSASQANTVVQKIIQYEKNPVMQASFYETALSAAYYQDDNSDSYADRRFAQTAEEILQYLTTQTGKTVNRVYYTGSTKTPLYWNNTYYSAGESVPTYLRKPGFPWTGNANNIRTFINDGTFIVYHRDHGYDLGWGDPAFNNTNVASLDNPDKWPIVASINCQTGKFLVPECFSEAFLRHANGGAVGVFGHAEVSYSGYNDGIAMGVIDAIFAQPGLIPNFTGTGHVSGTITPHDSILTMGDVADQALLRMMQTWGDDWGLGAYQHNIFHYFGDPATRIFTQMPVVITASHQNSIHCQDTTLQINSCNIQDAMATLLADGQLIGMTYLQNGSGSIVFSPTASNNLVLTISAPNTKPYIQNIQMTGQCVIADFEVVYPYSPCFEQAVVFEDRSSGFITQLDWNFGLDAQPQTAQGSGPHSVYFSTGGMKNITLIAHSPNGNDTIIKPVFVDSICTHIQPLTGTQNIQSCSGVLFDNGYTNPYLSGSDCHTIITSPGASEIALNFVSFDVEASSGCNNAYVRIISGNPVNGTVIGTYCNNNVPVGIISVPNDTVTVSFYAPNNTIYQGFELHWNCTQQSIPPVALFDYDFADMCGNIIAFQDQSLHQPFAWEWDFGDGVTSTLQHPVHEYTNNGVYNVQLIATNSFGSDTLLMPALIGINRPSGLNDTVMTVCRSEEVKIPGGSSLHVLWYDSPSSLSPIAYTDTLVYYANTPNTTFWCRDFQTGGSYAGAKPNNSGAGGYFNASTSHHLGFDVMQPISLKAVTVYAQDNGNRTFTVRDGNNNVVYTSTHMLSTGMNRIQLNYILMPDNDYKIDAGQYNKLYRNGDPNGPDFYPYVIPGILSINRSSAGYPNAGKYYYFFYDWEVEVFCLSAPASKEVNVLIADTTITAWPGTSLCQADSVLLTGPANVSYVWQPGGETTDYIYLTQPGSYYATIESGACNAVTNTIVIDGELPPHADFTYAINGLQVSFTNNSTGNTYHWTFGDGNESWDTNPVHTYAADGDYTVTLITQNSCGSDTMTVQVNVSTVSLPEVSLSGFTVYPNPASESITIDLSQLDGEKAERISILNSVSQTIEVYDGSSLNEMQFVIPVHSFAEGIYIIVVQTSESVLFGKFVKE